MCKFRRLPSTCASATHRTAATIKYSSIVSRVWIPYHDTLNNGRLDLCHYIALDFGWIQGRRIKAKPDFSFRSVTHTTYKYKNNTKTYVGIPKLVLNQNINAIDDSGRDPSTLSADVHYHRLHPPIIFLRQNRPNWSDDHPAGLKTASFWLISPLTAHGLKARPSTLAFSAIDSTPQRIRQPTNYNK